MRDLSRRTNRGEVKPARRRVAVALAVLAASLVASLAAAASAAAVVVVVHGHTFSYEPVPGAPGAPRLPAAGGRNPARATPPGGGNGNGGGKGAGNGKGSGKGAGNVTDHGGPVMPSNTNYAIYWDPPGAPAYPSGYQTGIDRFFEDVAHDSGRLTDTDSILTQYGANYESHFGGALNDTDPYPANGCAAAPRCLTDAQMRAEIVSFVQAQKLPVDLEHGYFLLTPEGVESCWEANEEACSAGTASAHRAYCAYHRFVLAGGSPLVYAVTPFVEKLGCDLGEEHPNGNASDATIAGGLAHEHSEMITDPEGSAWYDEAGNEVADKCRAAKATKGEEKKEYGEPLGQAPNGSDYNQLIDAHTYLYQQVWSNSAAGCGQRVAEYPTVTKVAPKAGPSVGGTNVTITGSGFSGSVTVHFGEAAATGVHVVNATTITCVSPAGAPNHKADVSVTTSGGTSPVTKKSVFKYQK